MPSIPSTNNLTASSVDILNAIRNSASANYRDYIPAASEDVASIKQIGAIMMNYPLLQNEFLTALVNRIGRVLITSKMYSNPWSIFKRGILEFGETIEEIFVNIAKPFQYDPALAESKVFERQIPDVRAAFHILNYQKYYKTTIQQEQLRQAFLSWDGITDLISKIVDSMYTGANYDEFQVMKYLLAKHLLNGQLYPKTISAVSSANMKGIVSTIKGMSNALTFMSTEYNNAGVSTHTEKSDQYIIVNSDFDASMDVEVLASAFNMSKADFIGHRVLVDGFGKLDTNRLALIFAGDDNYEALSSDEITALNSIPAILVDKNYFMIYDNLMNFTEQYNGQGLYWNYWYHVWKTFSVSPFANAVVFVPDTPSITSVTVTPATATVSKGQNFNMSVAVVTEGFASQAVEWEVEGTNADDVTINIYGELHIPADTEAEEVTVTATSLVDSTKSDSATITIA